MRFAPDLYYVYVPLAPSIIDTMANHQHHALPGPPGVSNTQPDLSNCQCPAHRGRCAGAANLHPGPSKASLDPGIELPEGGCGVTVVPGAGTADTSPFCPLRDKTTARPAARPMNTTRITARRIHSCRRVRRSRLLRDLTVGAMVDGRGSDFSISQRGSAVDEAPAAEAGEDPKRSGDVRSSAVTTSGSGDSTRSRLVVGGLYAAVA